MKGRCLVWSEERWTCSGRSKEVAFSLSSREGRGEVLKWMSECRCCCCLMFAVIKQQGYIEPSGVLAYILMRYNTRGDVQTGLSGRSAGLHSTYSLLGEQSRVV